MTTVLQCAVALPLLWAAASKLAAPRSTHRGLATFGLRGERVRWIAWGALAAVEAALAVLVALGFAAAAYVAAALMLAFALAMARALAAGRAGAPCGCFGQRSKVSRAGIARNVVLAAALAVTPTLAGADLATNAWLGIGLGVALAGVAVLGVALLALAREVGRLRMSLGPQSALEIPEEGPELGSRSGIIGRFGAHAGQTLALAVFVSDGCRMCRSLEPALRSLEAEPVLALQVFDEARDADAWAALDVPGSPFAVALGIDGTVLAKGTFNNLAQLESVLATAERRADEEANA